MTRANWTAATALVVALALLMIGAPAIAADLRNNLRNNMGEERFRAAGLHRLSASELAVLQAWLDGSGELPAARLDTPPEAPVAARPTVATNTSTAAPAASESDGGLLQRFGLRPELVAPAEPEAIEARIDGEFKGWSGATVFRLDNGQVWQQRTRNRYFKSLQSPAVRISKATIGYRMEVIETGAATRVKRIE